MKKILLTSAISALSLFCLNQGALAVSVVSQLSEEQFSQTLSLQQALQRSCDPADLNVYKNNSIKTTACAWRPSWEDHEDLLRQPPSNRDVGVQMTLHDPEHAVEYVMGTCVFTPINTAEPDQVTEVEGNKSADVLDYTVLPLNPLKKSQIIKFVVKNKHRDFMNSNINVGMRVNYPYTTFWDYMNPANWPKTPTFTPGDTMDCTIVST